MIKAIIFDIDGVVAKEPGKEAREILAKKFNFPAEKFSEFAKANLKKSWSGKLDYEQFFEELIKFADIKAKKEDLINEWLNIRDNETRIIPESEHLIKELTKNYVTISLTNSTQLNDKIRIKKGIYSLFKLNIISWETGYSKPDEEIYQILIKKLKSLEINPEEAVLIDDNEEYLAPAKNLQINTILFKDNNQLQNELKNLGVKCQKTNSN